MLSPHCLVITVSSLLLLPVALFADRIICDVPSIFTVDVDSDNKKIFVYEPEISVVYERSDLAVYEYPDTNAVNILINNTLVSFSGHVLEEGDELDTTDFKTTRIFNTKIAGSARLMKNIYNDDTLTDCDLYLSRNRKDGGDLPSKLQFEILHRAATGVRSTLCGKLGKITLDDLRTAKNHPFAFGPLAILSRKASIPNENLNSANAACGLQPKMSAEDLESLVTRVGQLDLNSINRDGFQSTLNVLVDIAIAEIVKKVREENPQGSIKLPDISQRFAEHSFWKPHIKFDAHDGIFSDITTLSRTEDATLSHSGLKFIAHCGFGFSTARIHYNKYKLKYGASVSGEVWADVDGAAMAMTVAVDYNQKPCRASLQELRVTELGKMNIKLTGLGPMNKALSKIVTWLTKKWREEIIVLVQEKVRGFIEADLNSFNCEKYRP